MPGWKSVRRTSEPVYGLPPCILPGGENIADERKNQGRTLETLTLVLRAIRLIVELLRLLTA